MFGAHFETCPVTCFAREIILDNFLDIHFDTLTMSSLNFRKTFNLTQNLNKWYPGHMFGGMRRMQKNLRSVDCIIEVHDARIPFSGRNPEFRSYLTSIKPHILVLNKADLCDMSHKHAVEEKLVRSGINKVIFANLRNGNQDRGFKQVLPTALKLVKKAERFNRNDSESYQLMVIGVPNVGKSTLINRFRSLFFKSSAAATGANAGVTRHVMERIKICDVPKTYVLDTPGILEPRIDPKRRVEEIMKLALISSMSDDVIGHEIIADYQLYWLNRHGYFSYVDYFGLEQPCDQIYEVLFKIAVNMNLNIQTHDRVTKKPVNVPSIALAARKFIKSFRDGSLGTFFMDLEEVGISPKHSSVLSWDDYKMIKNDLSGRVIKNFDPELREKEEESTIKEK